MNKRRSPIPPHAKRVFAGKIFDVWQWEQKMFDGSVQIFERLKRPDTAQVIPVVGDGILIQLEEQPDMPHPFPAIPGGRLDSGESPLEAAQRELLEETGYASDDWVLWKQTDPSGKMEWTVYTFVARACTPRQDPALDAGERIQTKLVSFEEFLDLADDPSFYSPELVPDMLRARYVPEERDKLAAILYGN